MLLLQIIPFTFEEVSGTLAAVKSFKAYKFRIYPNVDQRIRLAQHFGACRWVYNRCLEDRMAEYAATKKSLSCFTQAKRVTQWKQEADTSWLKEISAQTLELAVHNLDHAYTKFFREKKGFPKFKSKYGKQSCSFRQGNKVNGYKVYVAKFREGIKYRGSREITGEIKTVTVSLTATGKYFASILVKEEIPETQVAPLAVEKAIGIDLGIKTFAVMSDGDKIETPSCLRKAEAKLKREQRRLSRRKKGSANRNKQRKKVALVHEKVANQRKDFMHKESRRLVDKNHATTFCFETLSIQNMMKNHCMAKSISDAGWYMFRQFITYKADWAGKNVLTIGRFTPSSKMCNHCGHINKDLKLQHRTWVCPQCGESLDRDLNAAYNVRDMAFTDKNLINTAADAGINACEE